MISKIVVVAAAGLMAASLHAASKPVTVELKDAKGESVGTAVLSDSKGGVKIKLDLKNLPPGEHAIHIHQVAKCEPPFTIGGGAFQPRHEKTRAGKSRWSARRRHEKLHGQSERHRQNNGAWTNASIWMTTRTRVFANGGTALMIHEKADDMKSDPAGNAGARIACGVITK